MPTRKPPSERRKHPVGSDPRKEDRRVNAALRQAARNGRTPAGQVAQLDHRPGEARKERARLSALMAGSPSTDS